MNFQKATSDATMQTQWEGPSGSIEGQDNGPNEIQVKATGNYDRKSLKKIVKLLWWIKPTTGL